MTIANQLFSHVMKVLGVLGPPQVTGETISWSSGVDGAVTAAHSPPLIAQVHLTQCHDIQI